MSLPRCMLASDTEIVTYFLYERPDGSCFTSSIHPSKWGKLDCPNPDSQTPPEDVLQWSPKEMSYTGMEFEVPKELIPTDYYALQEFDTFPATTGDGKIVLMLQSSPYVHPTGSFHGVMTSHQGC